ncbi:unnamed protein product [Owenia fusiformis]|uniref:Uncharacterized protein n=1 Tax=Owenia fusiformis TaxID=6347 RepID=A0A8J1XRT1_OWEFU|nr:unnamed protein product [Owenia fusiformis]
MASCPAVTAMAIFLVASICGVIAMATSYWMELDIAGAVKVLNHWGLWQKCTQNWGCKWVYDKDVKIKAGYAGWFQAVQGLYTVGLVFGICAAIGSMVNLCSGGITRCCTNFTATLAFISFLSMAASLALFGVKYHDIYGDIPQAPYQLSWSFYFAVSATLLEILAMVLYLCVGCCNMGGSGVRSYQRI